MTTVYLDAAHDALEAGTSILSLSLAADLVRQHDQMIQEAVIGVDLTPTNEAS